MKFEIIEKMNNLANLAQYKHKYGEITQIIDNYYDKNVDYFEPGPNQISKDISRNTKTLMRKMTSKESPTLRRGITAMTEKPKIGQQKDL